MEVVAAISLAHSSNAVARSPFAKVFSHPFCVSPQQGIIIQFSRSYCGQCARFMGLERFCCLCHMHGQLTLNELHTELLSSNLGLTL